MKFPILAAAAAILTGIHAQECSVCPGGINVDPDTETENGFTCGNIQSDAARFEADNAICDRIKGFEEICCGGAMDTTTETPVTEALVESDTTCSVCPNGITVDADTETQGNNVCGTIQADAAQFEADDSICGRIKAFESTCCPDVPTTVAAISTTETGSTTAAAATTVVVNSTAAAFVSSTVVTASTEATLTTAVSGPSCVVCPGGITAPLTLSTVAGKTCADLLPDAAEHENGDALCEIIKQSEDICCPVGGFVVTPTTSTETTATAAASTSAVSTAPAIITTITTSTEATANTAATTTAASDEGKATSSTIAASVSSTTAAFDFHLNVTNSPTKAPAPAVITSKFNEVYDASRGFSLSARPGSTIASIFIVCTMFAQLS